MPDTRRAQVGAGNVSGWVPRTAAVSTLLPSQVTSGQAVSGQADLANTTALFGTLNSSPLPAGARTTPGVTGTSPLSSRVSGGWTAGRIAPVSGPGQNFGVGTLADPRLASRAATGQPANTGNVITASAYRTPSVPGFLAGAVNDLNSGTTARTAMQAEWLSRLANNMGNAGDDAYLWAEVLRSNGGLNPGTGGGPSFGAAITPGAIAREQANLARQQAQDVMMRNWAGQNAVGGWNESKVQDRINEVNWLNAGSGSMPAPSAGFGGQLSDLNARLANAQNERRLLVDISNRGVGAGNLANRVTMPPNYAAPNGLINGTGYAIPYTSLPY